MKNVITDRNLYQCIAEYDKGTGNLRDNLHLYNYSKLKYIIIPVVSCWNILSILCSNVHLL